jgi:hypothetical protein
MPVLGNSKCGNCGTCRQCQQNSAQRLRRAGTPRVNPRLHKCTGDPACVMCRRAATALRSYQRRKGVPIPYKVENRKLRYKFRESGASAELDDYAYTEQADRELEAKMIQLFAERGWD